MASPLAVLLAIFTAVHTTLKSGVGVGGVVCGRGPERVREKKEQK